MEGNTVYSGGWGNERHTCEGDLKPSHRRGLQASFSLALERFQAGETYSHYELIPLITVASVL